MVGMRGLAVLVLVVEVETDMRVDGKEALTGEGDEIGVKEGTTGEVTFEGTLVWVEVEEEMVGERGKAIDASSFREGGFDFDFILGGGLTEALETER